jgi:hypothetical protein
MQYIQLQGQVAADLDTPLEGGFNLFIDTNDGSIKSKDSEGNISTAGGGLVETTYSELSASFVAGTLTPGTYYKITNFKTCYDQPNYDAFGAPITTGNYKTGSVSPIIVFALDSGSLAADAFQPQYPNDNIKYDVTFNQTEITTGSAFGRIVYRKDDRGNVMDYDFREVLFKRYDAYLSDGIYDGTISLSMTGSAGFISGSGTGFTNFSSGSIVGVLDTNNNPIVTYYAILEVLNDYGMVVTGSVINTVTGKRLVNSNRRTGMSWKKSNIISNINEYEYLTFDDVNAFNNVSTNNLAFTTYDDPAFLLPNNVFRDGSYRDNSFVCTFRNNTFNDDFDSNTITDEFYNNTIDDDFDNNTIHAPFYNNLIDVEFQQNLIMDSFYDNNFGDDDGTDVNNNIFKGQFSRNFNIGWNQMSYNTFNGSFIGNVILREFYNNTFNYAYDNFFNQYFNRNTIGENFYDNTFNQGCSDNIIGYNSRNNTFHSQVSNNTIGSNFYNNTIGELNQESYFEYNHIGYEFKGNQILGDFNKNRIADFFNANDIAYNFNKNTIGDYCYINDIQDDFEENVIGNNFESNTIQDNFKYNKIGNNFYNNTIEDDFGFGGGNYRGNVIGNNFINNTIGEYFYDNNIGDNFDQNTIGNYFQFNRIETPVFQIDFTQYYGNLTDVSYPPTNGTNGTYTGVTGTTNGIGINAEFTIDVTGSFVDNVNITNIGKLYEVNNTITIVSGSFGGTGDLVLTVTQVSPTPVVYTTANSNIVKNFNGDLKLTYIGTSFGIVGILDPFD